MALRKIITLPNENLRRKARKVSDFGPDLQTLIDDMIETMRDAPGVGLAAPQVDVPLRVIVVEFGDEEDDSVEPKLYTVVNPEIQRSGGETVVGTEGCLSIPGIVGDVARPSQITVKGQNRRGQAMKLKAKGWLARIFLHEIDHLEGVLFVDLAERIWRPEEQEAEEDQEVSSEQPAA
ncbi:MAG: peptide deformylase [Anaerolineae bacterium]|nr:peptide deformylase [Anaerolineae bacterium]